MVKIHRGYEKIDEIRNVWERLQKHPNTDFDHYLLVCKLRDEVIHPWVLSVWDGDACRAIIAGRLERIRLRPRIGYARLPGVATIVLTLIHEGVLGELDEGSATSVVEALTGMVRHGEADMVSIHSLPERLSGFWNALARQRGLGLGARQPAWTVHRALTLEAEPDFLIRKMRSKHRSWVKRKERELEQKFHGEFRWIWHRVIEDIVPLCQRMEAVAKITYQRGLGAGFTDGEATRQRLAVFSNRGQMRICMLEINGVPKAFWLGHVYGGAFHSGATGYTPDMRPFEVGTLMFLRMVEELVREGVRNLDFGLGDAEYKERFGDQSWREASVQLFGLRWKSRLLRVWLGSANVMDQLARGLVTRMGMAARLKQWWRARLRK